MGTRPIAIVTDIASAKRISALINRTLGLPVEIRTPGSIRRIAARVSEAEVGTLLYSWSGDEQSVLLWLKAQGHTGADVRFIVFAYKGFNMEHAYAVNRSIAWCQEIQPVAYAA